MTARPRLTRATRIVLRGLFDASPDEVYGYELAKSLASHQSAYAILRKLERAGMTTSRQQIVEGRARRYYRLTALGVQTCTELFSTASRVNRPLVWR